MQLLAQAPPPTDIFGTVSPPPGVEMYDAATGVAGGNGIGIVVFASNLIKIGTIVAGLWVMVNFILAGYDYIFSAGDSGATKRVTDRITMSVIGLVILVMAYGITAVISLILFGDAAFILNPVITGPGTALPATP